jgi:hypothetical protein
MDLKNGLTVVKRQTRDEAVINGDVACRNELFSMYFFIETLSSQFSDFLH